MDRNELPIESVAIAIIAFGIGLARSIVSPSRRGIAGFVTAMVVAVICGCFAGFMSSSIGLNPAWQYATSAFFAVMGDRVIFAMLQTSLPRTTINHETNNITNASIDTFQTGKDAKRE